ncbi:MAG TPA: cytidylate kinase family protein [Thermoanaerobaculia bacterium]|nr:cytidylate kinase family protein [Thermoanaerobaculia bacterium]
MQMITISRQFGAGGAALAEALVARLGWRLIDRQLVTEVAGRLRLPEEEVAARNERVEHLSERVGTWLCDAFPEMMLPPWPPAAVASREVAAVVEAVLTEAAREPPVIVVGHGGQCLFADRPDAFHLRLRAPLADRAARAAARLGLTPEEAAEQARRRDADRRLYLRSRYGRDLEDPALYHLVADTSRVPIEILAELVAGLATRAGAGS